MLLNGLGEAIAANASGASRFVDLFSGSAAVAHHVAERYPTPVLANDLQSFSSALAEAVLERTEPMVDRSWIDGWIASAMASLPAGERREARRLQDALATADMASLASSVRAFCSTQPTPTLAHAYGGHYFSAEQALALQALRANLPERPCRRAVALSALIQAGSRCAAAPGHTAQPFKPNDTAGPFLREAWRRDLGGIVRAEAFALCPRHATVKGATACGEAIAVAKTLGPSDLAFVDPPYSGVHYSRFYHVLESIARGTVAPAEQPCAGAGAAGVSGTGRYPCASIRPRSDFSVAGRSRAAFDALFAALAEAGARTIVTYPVGGTSNGADGEHVLDAASRWFVVEQFKVTSRFSTLGGNSRNRQARQDALEMILVLRP